MRAPCALLRLELPLCAAIHVSRESRGIEMWGVNVEYASEKT